jgi:hypothetical protein
VDVREDEGPLDAPAVDLEVVLGAQAQNRFERVHHGVPVDPLLGGLDRVDVGPLDGADENGFVDPLGELVHRQDAVGAAVRHVLALDGAAVGVVEGDEGIHHAADDLRPGRLPPARLVVADDAVGDAHGVGQLVLGNPELLPPFPDGLARLRREDYLARDLLLEFVGHRIGYRTLAI